MKSQILSLVGWWADRIKVLSPMSIVNNVVIRGKSDDGMIEYSRLESELAHLNYLITENY